MAVRRASGFSLIEAVFVVFITGVISAGILSIAAAQNATNFRAYNKMGSLMAARRLETNLQLEAHMARFFGDQSGPDFNKFPASNNLNTYTFPTSTSNADWPTPQFSLNKQNLILQVPIFDQNGVPTMIGNQWNVDTFIYMVLPDKNNPGKGQFVLQKALFPGDHSSQVGYVPPIDPTKPQTLLTGIVGPIDPTDTHDPVAGVPPPAVFTYLYNWPGSSVQESSDPKSVDVDRIKGVAINLELFSNESSSRSDYIPKTIAFKSEFFRRGNAQ
ncbi:hypothetical protein KA183_14630 [bacterium]|nr:hypothetical protein [bacterium]